MQYSNAPSAITTVVAGSEFETGATTKTGGATVGSEAATSYNGTVTITIKAAE